MNGKNLTVRLNIGEGNIAMWKASFELAKVWYDVRMRVQYVVAAICLEENIMQHLLER